jgi:hypothetical protein
VQVKLTEFSLPRPRRVGGMLKALPTLGAAGMEEFWHPRLADSREGTSRYRVLMLQMALPVDRSGQRVATAPPVVRETRDGDLLGEGPRLAAKDTLYRCLTDCCDTGTHCRCN